MNSRDKKKIFILVALVVAVVVLGFGESAVAVEYHVATGGDDGTGDGSLLHPWRTPEYGAKQLSPGDTLLIHGGTYNLSVSNLPIGQATMDRGRAFVSPQHNVDGTAENPFIIRGYGNGTVLLDAGANPQYTAVGSNYGDYVYVDGISVRGAAAFMWASHCKIINCDLYGGIDCPQSNGGDNFGCVLRVEGGSNTIVRNNRLHDNQEGITLDNSPLLMEYDSTNLLIENNDIYNSCASGIHLKDNPEKVTIRYNYFYNNSHAGVNVGTQDRGHNVTIYQNIFRSNGYLTGGLFRGQLHLHFSVEGIYIYNNDFINGNLVGDIVHCMGGGTGASNISAWNNIFYQPSVRYYDVGRDGGSARLENDWLYSDYNDFYDNASWKNGASTWSTLASFSASNVDRNSNTVDANSVISDPGFVNAGGINPEDYKRTSYPTNGRGGAYASVMGAYIVGDEIIGYIDSEQDTTHEADLNDDGVIDMPELMAYIARWKAGYGVTKTEVLDVRAIWFAGGVY